MNFVLDLLGRIPRPILAAFGGFLGWLIWTLRIRRRVALDNLRLAFPEKTEAERRAIARANYRHLGQMIPDFLRVPTLPPEELDRIFVYEGWENYERAAALGHGVVACTAHFGNFDLLASAHTRRGVPITQLSREMGKQPLQRPAAPGAPALRRRGPGHRQGPDHARPAPRPQGGAGARVRLRPERGGARPSSPPSSASRPPPPPTPAFLARRTGAAVVFVVSVPLGDGRHQVVIEGPLRAARHRRPGRRRPGLHAAAQRQAGGLGPAPSGALVLAPPAVEDAPAGARRRRGARSGAGRTELTPHGDAR